MPFRRRSAFALPTICILAFLKACLVVGTVYAQAPAADSRSTIVTGQTPKAQTPKEPAQPPASQEAVARSLALLERAARHYPRHRDCFACHHQSFPMLVQVEGKRIGLRPDEPTRQAIARFTRDWFSQRQTDLRAGRAIDGRAITVAYGLWTLEMAEVDAADVNDAVTKTPVAEAMVEYLLQVQRADGAWEPEAHRPPAEESQAFVTALALRGLRRVATTRRALNAADRAFEWLSMNAAAAIESQSVDEQAGHLLSYAWRSDRFPGERTAFRQERIKEWSERLVKLQRGDGGWSQRSGMESDPYATGLALWSLAESGFDPRSEPYQRGAVYLRSRQAADGSWHTRSRCEPFQPYFDNGDPYGRDQFLSLMATAWAAAALARTENAGDDD